MVAIYLLHICVRNDETPSTIVRLNRFIGEESAANNVVDGWAMTQCDKYSDEELGRVRKHLMCGKPLWIWEWTRRGNGDKYRILRISNPDEISFVFPDLERGEDDEKEIDELLEWNDDSRIVPLTQ